MIIHDGKKAAGMILSKMDGSGADKPEAESGGDEHLKAIAEDMLAAFEKKDAHMLMSAMKAFMGCIEAEDEKQDAME